MKHLVRIAQLLLLLATIHAAAFAAVSVSISPSSGEVQPGGQLQFTATVSGTTNNVVIWSLSGISCSGIACGHISSLGVYTAPTAAPSYPIVAITATALADLTQSATVSVFVGTALNVAVSVSPATAGVRVTERQLFVANVTGTSNTAVNWTLAGHGCSESACGTISTTGVYSAPANIPSPAQVTITATSVVNPLRSGSATVTVEPPIIVSVAPSAARVVIGQQEQFTANVTNTSNTAVGWTLSGVGCTGSGCGTVTPSGLYTAPASVPAPAQVIVTATSNADPSKSASATVTVVLPVSVRISPVSANVVAEKFQQFTATVSNALNNAVTWSVGGSGCSGATCGTVSSSGLYTAPGSVPSPALVVVTATSVADPTKFASARVTILPPVIVNVSPIMARVVTGETQQFTATVSNTSNHAVTWSVAGSGCSGAGCGAVSASGLYTAPASVPSPALVTVTATSVADPTKFASASVTVLLPVAVKISPTSADVIGGKTQQFTANVSNASDTSVTWKVTGAGCSGITCGTVSTSGLYTAPLTPPSPPLFTVTATSVADPSKSASASVTILSPVVVKVSPATAQIGEGKTQQFTATVTGTSDTSVTWSLSGCSGAACGTISGSGLYTAPASVPIPTQITVTATSKANTAKSAQAVVTVVPPIFVSISPATVQIVTGQQQQFTATVTGTANKSVSWSLSGSGCSGPSCGIISSTGLYTAPAKPPAPALVAVTATSSADTSESASASVTVVNPVVVTISPISTQVITGRTQQFHATITGSSDSGVTWSLSGAGCLSSTCGTISGSGLYTAPAVVPTPPQVRVTATSNANSSKSATALVTVIPPVVVTVSPPSAELAISRIQQFTANVTGTSNTTVTWSVSGKGCSGSACGTITSGGLYTAPGTVPNPAQVTVKAASNADTTVSGTATVTISVGVAVSVSPNPALVAIDTQQQFTATVTGTLNTSVTWTLAGSGCSGSGCGTITPTGLYTAPGTVPNPAQVKVTATSHADTTKSASATVTISLPILVKITPANSLVPLKAREQFRATVSGSTDTAVLWTVSGAGCSGETCGTVSSAGLYTAPADLPTPAVVTVTAASAADPSHNGVATITLLSSNDAKLAGQYAFLFKGFNNAGVYQAAGAFIANGAGKISTGIEDVNSTAGPSTSLAINGTYDLGGDGRGSLTITNSLGSFTYQIALDALGNNGTFIEFDSTGIRGSGIIERQDPSAFSISKLSGSFAFNLTGSDSNSKRIAAVGVVLPKSGAIVAGSLDVNDAGVVPSTFATTNGDYSVNNTGRGGMNLSIAGFDGGFFKFAMYVVSADEFFLLSIDPLSVNNPIFAGPAERQSGVPFSTASFNGHGIFSVAGDNGSQAQVIAGRLRFDGNSGTNAIYNQNVGGTSSSTVLDGAYDVQLNGRGTLNLDNNDGTSTVWYVYAIAPNKAFMLDASTSFVGDGELDPQLTTPPFGNADVLGTYLISSGEAVSSASTLSSGIVDFDGADVKGIGSLAGTEDLSISPTTNSTSGLTGTYSISGTENNGSGALVLTTPDGSSFALWVISESSALALNLGSSNAQPTLFRFDQ